MATKEEISQIFDIKLKSFRIDLNKEIDTKLSKLETSLKEKLLIEFTKPLKDLKLDIAKQDDTLNKHNDELKQLNTKLVDEAQKIAKLEEKNTLLEHQLDDIINRGMRNNLILKGIPETDQENYASTELLVADTLAEITGKTSDDIRLQIERAHRSGVISRRPRNIYMRFFHHQMQIFILKPTNQ